MLQTNRKLSNYLLRKFQRFFVGPEINMVLVGPVIVVAPPDSKMNTLGNENRALKKFYVHYILMEAALDVKYLQVVSTKCSHWDFFLGHARSVEILFYFSLDFHILCASKDPKKIIV